MTQYGYVSMRNQDGTQWAAIEYGNIQWVDSKREATPISQEVFKIMELRQEETRLRDCPDNGFYGIYNLHFSPITRR